MAFHPYPQLIQRLFNVNWFGPPSGFTQTSAWPRVDHKVSRLPPLTLSALFRLAFASAPRLITLNLASEEQLVGSLCKRHAVTHYWAPTACKRTVSGTVSLRCSRCFSPFPHGTGPLSVSQEYLALPDGPGRFTQDSSCPALLRIPTSRTCLHVRGCHPLWRRFPALFRFTCPRFRRSYNPGRA